MIISTLPNKVSASDIAPERLANNPALTEQQKIAEASRQFEAVLLRQILAATQKTVIPSKFTDNSTSADIYRDMITTQLADSISKSGSFGLAQTFEKQLAPRARALSEPSSQAPGPAHSYLPRTAWPGNSGARPVPAGQAPAPARLLPGGNDLS
jgi:peptidoglycan hydrolase FlgJ